MSEMSDVIFKPSVLRFEKVVQRTGDFRLFKRKNGEFVLQKQVAEYEINKEPRYKWVDCETLLEQ